MLGQPTISYSAIGRKSFTISCMHEYMSVSPDSDLIPREIDEHLIRFGKPANAM